VTTFRQPINRDDLRAAIEMASDREQVRDQLGRRWSRWYAGHPSCAARCAQCGARIELGYLLVGAEQVKLCARHVEHRWV
jgi:hypothetical protein